MAAAHGAAQSSAHAAETAHHRRWGMVIDLDRCTACGACSVACRQENNIPAFGPDDAHKGTHIEWMSMIWQDAPQEDGLPTAMPFPCQHCASAPCVKVCPVGATFKTPEGITMQIWERCIGCRYCMVACPYGRRSFNWDEPRWDGTLTQLLNPDVATRPHGVVEKCTFCYHRLRKVVTAAELEDRPVRDEDCQRLPACAAACPAQAITFGDLHDPEARVAELARDPRRFQLLDHLGTDPSVIYLKRDQR
ncbi:MAG: 4Fe-4S dicluster domain-containing protein [Myxococcales bacterium]|nr:4Fe-4S dicluster domain-containing protein [Myxococcales bacterium]